MHVRELRARFEKLELQLHLEGLSTGELLGRSLREALSLSGHAGPALAD